MTISYNCRLQSLCLYRAYRPHLPSTNHVNTALCRTHRIVIQFGRHRASPYGAQFGFPQASGDSTIASHPPDHIVRSRIKLAFRHKHFVHQNDSRNWSRTALRPPNREFIGFKDGTDFGHPSHRLFSLLPHGKWYWSAKSRSKRLLNSFYPQAIRHLNS
jgi:hypothetical protein